MGPGAGWLAAAEPLHAETGCGFAPQPECLRIVTKNVTRFSKPYAIPDIFREMGETVENHTGNDDSAPMARAILAEARVIAVVGASPNPNRPSNDVARYLIEQGFEVIPVRPKVSEILGRPCYATLEEIPVSVDLVDVFRRAEACPDIARSAVAIGARALWLQEGIVSQEAAGIARAGGLRVVMDLCVKKVHHDMDR